MNAREVYNKIGVPDNLQLHMLRVAAFASLVLDHWTAARVDVDSIMIAALFHDLAKPVTLDMSKQSQFVKTEEELFKLQQLHDGLISRYGSDEHVALRQIFIEFGFSQNSIRIINNFEWDQTDRLIGENDAESLVPIYSDMRIGPQGVLVLLERLAELHSRRPIENYEIRVEAALNLEQFISSHTSLELSTVSTTQIEQRLEKISQLQVTK